MRLHFTDGEGVQALLIQIDAAEHDDLMYEVAGRTYVASLESLLSWSPAEPGPTEAPLTQGECECAF